MCSSDQVSDCCCALGWRSMQQLAALGYCFQPLHATCFVFSNDLLKESCVVINTNMMEASRSSIERGKWSQKRSVSKVCPACHGHGKLGTGQIDKKGRTWYLARQSWSFVSTAASTTIPGRQRCLLAGIIYVVFIPCLCDVYNGRLVLKSSKSNLDNGFSISDSFIT